MKNCKKKEEIISTGSKLIIEKGYLNTSIQDITSKMGIAKGSFYTYFKSKDEFILTIIF
ncbi:TetR/AcrR family transcriptional regulator, partial [Fusobacterium sp.]